MTETATQEKPVFKKKKFFTKNKPKKIHQPHFDDTDYQEEESNSKNSFNTDEHQLFNMIQKRTNIDKELFWNTLNKSLKTNTFDKILRNDMNLISYSILYEKTDIFNDLLENYGLLISKDNMEQSMLKLCYNKDPEILARVFSYYKQHHDTPSEAFINTFISHVTKSSYREENNFIILEWVSPLLNQDNKNNFWNSIFEYKNVPLMLLSLEHKNTELKDYLKSNINQYEHLIKISGREHTINKLVNTNKVKTEVNSKPETPVYDHTAPTETFSLNSDIKQSSKTEIVIKKKKKLL